MVVFNYEVGVLLPDRPKFWEFVFNLNEDSDEMYHINVRAEFDDPDGYYVYFVQGTSESYKCFLEAAFVKSLVAYGE